MLDHRHHLSPRGRDRPSATARLAPLILPALLFTSLAVDGRPGSAAVVPDGFTDSLVVGTLQLAVGIAFLPDGRLLVVEKHGRVRLIVNGNYGATDPLMTVDSLRYSLESGLLGVAVDPGWPNRPYIYLYYDAQDSTVRISRFRASGDLDQPGSRILALDRDSRYELFRDIPDRNPSHNGGSLRFGPDGMLYAALGEDVERCAAQDTVSLRGVLLRLEVDDLPDGPGGPPDKSLLTPPDNPFVNHPHPNARLVWALGLRNPFRFHIDPATGGVFIADVGWTLKEEIDLVDGPGLNFGWPYYEADYRFPSTPCIPDSEAQFTLPIHSYWGASFELAAVIGAGPYRSTDGAYRFPDEYQGDYFYSDFYQGFLRRLKLVDGVWIPATPVPGQPSTEDWGQGFRYVSDYLVGPDGALWYCYYEPQGNALSQVRRILFSIGVAGVSDPPRGAAALFAPRPSPASDLVELAYTLARPTRVDLTVFDVTGRRVRRLVRPSEQPAGRHSTRWDLKSDEGRGVPAGIYLAVLTAGSERLERRIAVVR